MRAVYLHGFASSPASSKATFLVRKLRERGVETAIPDLNLPEFTTVTVTRMLETTQRLLNASAEPAVLIGSSLGGFVAINVAARWPERVDRLVLLAPAVEFADRRMREFGPATIDDWKRAGFVNVFHYAYGRMMPVRYDLYSDARRYDAMRAHVDMPTIVFQGLRDTVVEPASVSAWSAPRPNVELHLLDDDHQLTASLGFIWTALSRFLDLAD